MNKIARFFKSIAKPCAFGAASAALLVPAFPPYSVTPLLFIGLVPLMLGAANAPDRKSAFFTGLSCMVAFVVLGFNWISYVAVSFGGLPWIVGQITLILFSLFGEMQFLIFALLCHEYFKRRKGPAQRPALFIAYSTVGLGGTYVAADWLYPKIFPNTLGHALIAWPRVVQIAEVTGAYGLSLFLVAFNVLVFFACRSGSVKAVPKTVLAGIGLILALFTAFFFWGGARIHQLEALDQGFTRHFKFAAIQANVGDTEKMASERGYVDAINTVLGTYHAQSLKVAALPPQERPDLIIWPETAFPLLFMHFSNPVADATSEWGRSFVRNVIRQTEIPLYFGGYSARDRKDFNTGFLLNKEGELVDYYQKSILLAFGEYVPLGPFSEYIKQLVPSIADFGRGGGPKLLKVGGVKVSPQICYEGLVPDFSRTSAKLGADVLLNITNDSWFGDTTEPHLHLALTRFRSIEVRRPMIRSTNTGISALIDTAGRLHDATPVFTQTVLKGTVNLPGDGQSYPQTFFLRFGEVFAKLACLIAAFFLLKIKPPAIS